MRLVISILFKRRNIATVLYVSFLLMIILPIFFMCWFSIKSFNSILLSNLTSRALQTLEQVSYSVDSEVNQIILTTATITNDEQMIATATELHRSTDKHKFESSINLDHQIANYFHYTSDLISVLFFYKNEGVYEYKSLASMKEVEMRQSDWYRQVKSNQNKVKLFGAEDNLRLMQKGINITAAVSPPYNSPFYDVDMIYFIFRGSILQNLLKTHVPQPGYFVVLDANNRILSASEESMIKDGIAHYPDLSGALQGKEGHFVVGKGNKQVFVLYLTSQRTSLKYIHIVPYNELISQVQEVYNRTLLVALVGLIIFLIISFFLVRSMVKPILSLVRQMKRIKMGSLDVKIAATGPTEVYILGITFNEMMEQIKDLILQKEEKEVQRSQAEIAALQSQINPHFLVNTLNAIKIMAVISKSKHIQTMTESLMSLLSSAFNRGGSYATVSQELILLDHYFNIMRVRFGDRFEVEYQIEAEIRDMYILKLLLQPIVENAIVHGFHGAGNKGLIIIAGSLTDEKSIVFTVTDNGRGIDEEKKETFNGIGLSNIQQRIRLNFGDKYGVKIDSQMDQGTMVILHLPGLHINPDQIPSE